MKFAVRDWNVLARIGWLAAAAIVCNGCTTRNDTIPVNSTGTAFPPPTALRALSGMRSVTLVWAPSPAVDSAAFAGYNIKYHQRNAPSDSATAPDYNRFDSSFTIGNLRDTTEYVFCIQSVNANGAIGPRSDSIVWAPAALYYNVNLFGLSSADSCSAGISFSADSGVRAVSAVLLPDSVDIVFDDQGSAMVLESPSLATGFSLPRQTLFDTAYVQSATSIADLSLADSAFDTLTAHWIVGRVPLAPAGNGKGVALLLRTQRGNYARMFIHPLDSLGDFVKKDMLIGDPCYGENYITVDVSFQAKPFFTYARARDDASAIKERR